MAQYQTKASKGLDKVDPVWTRIRQEAEDAARREPELATFLYENVLHHDSLEGAVIHRVSERLGNSDVSGDLIRQAYGDALDDQPAIGEAFRADIVATIDRDPATTRLMEPVLYYKGFHAIQTHRLANWLLGKGRKDFALYLQSRSSAVFQCDINPAAKIGRGIFLDHATGFVVGETAVIDDDVSILHDVTLGGTGLITTEPAFRPRWSARPAAPNRRVRWTRCSTASCSTADFLIAHDLVALRRPIGQLAHH